MFKNYASVKTPVVSKSWIDISVEKRVELIKNELKKDSKTIDFEITQTTDDGQVVFKVEKSSSKVDVVANMVSNPCNKNSLSLKSNAPVVPERSGSGAREVPSIDFATA